MTPATNSVHRLNPQQRQSDPSDTEQEIQARVELNTASNNLQNQNQKTKLVGWVFHIDTDLEPFPGQGLRG